MRLNLQHTVKPGLRFSPINKTLTWYYRARLKKNVGTRRGLYCLVVGAQNKSQR